MNSCVVIIINFIVKNTHFAYLQNVKQRKDKQLFITTNFYPLSRIILNFIVLYFVFSFLPIFVPTKKGNYEKFSNQSRISK